MFGYTKKGLDEIYSRINKNATALQTFYTDARNYIDKGGNFVDYLNQQLNKTDSELNQCDTSVKLFAANEDNFRLMGSNVNDYEQNIERLYAATERNRVATQGWGDKLKSLGNQAFSNIATAAISIGVSALVNIVIEYFASISKAMEEARTAANKLGESLDTLDDYATEIESLNAVLSDNSSATEDVVSAKERLNEITDELCEKYGLERSEIDLTNGSLEEKLQLLRDIAQEEYNKNKQEHYEGNTKVLETMAEQTLKLSAGQAGFGTSQRTTVNGVINSQNKETVEHRDEIYDTLRTIFESIGFEVIRNYQKNGDYYRNGSHIIEETVSWDIENTTADVYTLYSMLQQVFDETEKLKAEAEKTGDTVAADVYNKTLTYISNVIKDWVKDQLQFDNNKEVLEQWIRYDSESKYGGSDGSFAKLENAQKELDEAKKSNDIKKITAAKSEWDRLYNEFLEITKEDTRYGALVTSFLNEYFSNTLDYETPLQQAIDKFVTHIKPTARVEFTVEKAEQIQEFLNNLDYDDLQIALQIDDLFDDGLDKAEEKINAFKEKNAAFEFKYADYSEDMDKTLEAAETIQTVLDTISSGEYNPNLDADTINELAAAFPSFANEILAAQGNAEELENVLEKILETTVQDMIDELPSLDGLSEENKAAVQGMLDMLEALKTGSITKLKEYANSLEYTQKLIERLKVADELRGILKSDSKVISQELLSSIQSAYPELNSYIQSYLASGSEKNAEALINYAVYHHSEKMITENGKEIKMHYYAREARIFQTSVVIPDKVCHLVISDKENSDITAYLHVRKINDDGGELVTVSVLNKKKAGNVFLESNEGALFQCMLSVKNDNGFMPVYRKNTHKSFEEEKNDMLYDSVNNYSYGHGCSSVHAENHGIVAEVRSEFVPQYRMLQMMPRLFDDSEYLYTNYWSKADRSVACYQLDSFIMQYQEWYTGLKNNTELIAKYTNTATDSFKKIERCISRLRAGVEVLRKNDTAWKSFVYMNEAMLLQRVKTKHCSPDVVSWHPFQMAYILQIIPDIVDNDSEFHKDVDLLWFPTGGGKTEAYLGLSAFSIFFRRLGCDKENINGVTIIMRYTLRLLTLQQFERATALVCACEHMRKKYGVPGGEISIGLWIGSGMTPNHIEDASEALKKIREDSTATIYESNPMQITKCPWCGAEIGVGGYKIIGGGMNISCCNNPDCEFHSHLPIYVVDDDIYRNAPTFVLSTVDKFARITWEEQAGNLLGANGCKPPELIIQDELHLISGPLGSITGIYEMAIENICKHYGKVPKIIASTATVKNADNQIKILYNRNMIQFPPNGLLHTDSFFAIEADLSKRPARTYLGICSIGSGTSEMLIKTFALLTFMKHLYRLQGKPTDVIDQFYTYVGYFNTLKELGSNSIIISDRISAEIKYLAAYKFKKEAESVNMKIDCTNADIPSYFRNDELTSRNSAKEIKAVLERLANKYTSEDCFDYIMASNMLSVGIDIDRLGVMCVYGQPKSNSEYIQATSRVGRTNPGLVISIYNSMRSRDKSYYEQFCYYHSTFYKYVEATSVTSYSPRAIEKALHCAMMAIIRHTIPKYKPNASACKFLRNDKEVELVKQSVLKRVNDIEPRITEYAEEWLNYYLDCWQKLVDSLPNKLVFSDYRNEDVALFRSADNQNGSDIPTILNSVRNVEPATNIYFIKR